MTNILEVAILRALMDRGNWDTLLPVVAEDMFDTTASRRLYSVISNMHEESTGNLLPSNVRLTLHATMKTQTGFRDELEDILNHMEELDDIDTHTLHRVVRMFCARSLSMKAVEYVAAHMDREDYDPSVPAGMLVKAGELSTKVDEDDLVEYATSLPPDQNVRSGVIGLGFSEAFDAYLDGGYGPGELAILVSISGVGKTSMLLKATSHAASLGKNVLYISREISKHKCVQRLDQCYTRMDKYDLVTNAQSVMNLRSKVPGSIWIKDWSHRETTVADIRSLILKMAAKGKHVDVLVVDYMELISAETYNSLHPRLNHKAVATDMRALAAELHIPVLTAWQAKQAAFNKQYLEKNDLGEDWNTVKIADIIVGLNQNSEENKGKVMRLNIIKQRESTNRSVMHMHVNLDRMIIRESSATEEEEDGNESVYMAGGQQGGEGQQAPVAGGEGGNPEGSGYGHLWHRHPSEAGDLSE
jgi:replicative DNA helicase